MTQAYTPGLKVLRRTVHRARRMLPVPGEVLVAAGARVRAEEFVAESSLPGDITPMNVAGLLGISAGDLPLAMRVQPGERVAAGALLARTPGLFGLFPRECKARTEGVLESFSQVTGQVMIRGEPRRVRVRAYLTGTVVEVFEGQGVAIESEVTLVQGIFGIGGEAYGRIEMACRRPDQALTADCLLPEHRGAIVVGGARVTAEAILAAERMGAAALVSGGIDDQDLRNVLGYDLGVAVTGNEKLPLTLIVTEGFGDVAMAGRTFELLGSRAGHEGAVNGATQIRAGVLRPEIVIPWGERKQESAGVGVERSDMVDGALAVGRVVRMIRDPYFGRIGTVAALPAEPQYLESGSRARVLTVRVSEGEVLTVPRANVELIEE